MLKNKVYTMTSDMKNLIEQPAWLALSQHYQDTAAKHMRDAFADESNRFERFSVKHGEILLDYSRNRITDLTMRLLVDLAESVDLQAKIAGLFAGNPVNTTEQRPALHTALRDSSGHPVFINNENITAQVADSQTHLFQFAADIHTGKRCGITGKPFQHIVNIGIGGSYLGSKMCAEALQDFAVSPLSFHFLSTVDPDHLRDVLHQVDPETTLFIISSKSFSTLETITNARAVTKWLVDKLGAKAPLIHTAAVTACKEKAAALGVADDSIFTFWDWVGGRYSIWSAIGLPLILMIGAKQFSEFLLGAHEIDHHFQEAPFKHNIPVILALLSIWYSNFFNTATQAIVPYSHRLRFLVPYIQQVEMESSGKSATLNGDRVAYTTGSVIFGEEGCNGQHSFHQMLHQGQHLIPVDFILIAKPQQHTGQAHQDLLLASALSQAYTLVHGRTAKEVQHDLKATALSSLQAEILSQHLIMDGNKPSNLMLLDRLNPKNLGALLALYEHKIFVQSAIWNINPFDQWGVESGKKTLPVILAQMENREHETVLDAATVSLIDHFKKIKGQS